VGRTLIRASALATAYMAERHTAAVSLWPRRWTDDHCSGPQKRRSVAVGPGSGSSLSVRITREHAQTFRLGYVADDTLIRPNVANHRTHAGTLASTEGDCSHRSRDARFGPGPQPTDTDTLSKPRGPSAHTTQNQRAKPSAGTPRPADDAAQVSSAGVHLDHPGDDQPARSRPGTLSCADRTRTQIVRRSANMR